MFPVPTFRSPNPQGTLTGGLSSAVCGTVKTLTPGGSSLSDFPVSGMCAGHLGCQNLPRWFSCAAVGGRGAQCILSFLLGICLGVELRGHE